MSDLRIPNSLAEYSTEALRKELYRRESGPRRSVIVPCDECRHFIFAKGAVPDDYNPCFFGHKMFFRTPRDVQDDNWGFYRPRCRARTRREKPVT